MCWYETAELRFEPQNLSTWRQTVRPNLSMPSSGHFSVLIPLPKTLSIAFYIGAMQVHRCPFFSMLSTTLLNSPGESWWILSASFLCCNIHIQRHSRIWQTASVSAVIHVGYQVKDIQLSKIELATQSPFAKLILDLVCQFTLDPQLNPIMDLAKGLINVHANCIDRLPCPYWHKLTHSN